MPDKLKVLIWRGPRSLRALQGTCPAYPGQLRWKIWQGFALSVGRMCSPASIAATLGLFVFVGRKPWYPGMCIVPLVVPTVSSVFGLGNLVSDLERRARGSEPYWPKSLLYMDSSLGALTTEGGLTASKG